MSRLCQPSVAPPAPQGVREDFSLRAEPATQTLEPSAHLAQVDGAHEPDLYLQDSESIWISQVRDDEASQQRLRNISNLSGLLPSQPRLASSSTDHCHSIFDNTVSTQQQPQFAPVSGLPPRGSAGSGQHVPVFSGFGASAGLADEAIAFAPSHSMEPHTHAARPKTKQLIHPAPAAPSAPRAQRPSGDATAPPKRQRQQQQALPPLPISAARPPKQPRKQSQASIDSGFAPPRASSFPAVPLDMYTDFAAAAWPQQLQGLGTAVGPNAQLQPSSELLSTPFTFALSSSVPDSAVPSSQVGVPRCSHTELLDFVQHAHHVAIVPVGTLCTPEGVIGFALKLQGVDLQHPLLFLECSGWLKLVPTNVHVGGQTAVEPAPQASPQAELGEEDIFDDLLGTGGGFDMDELLQSAPVQPAAASNKTGHAADTQRTQWTAWHEAWAALLAVLSMLEKRGTCAVGSMKHLLYPALQAMGGYGWPTLSLGASDLPGWCVELPLVRGSFLPACFPGPWVLDVSVAAWLLSEDASVEDGSFSVGESLQKHCPGREMPAGESAAEWTIQQNLDMLLSLGPVLRAKLRRLCMGRTYDDIAGQLTPVLASMELEGVCFDPDVCRIAESTIQKRLDSLERKAHECAGQVFMVTSSKECARVLYDDLGLTATEGRKWNPAQPKKMHKSTAEGMLLQLAAQHPLPVYILAHRKLSKVLNGFVMPLLKLAVPMDTAKHANRSQSLSHLWTSMQGGSVEPLETAPLPGIQRIFTQLNQTSTGTGRLSSSNPNLQNLPKRSLIPAGSMAGVTPVLGGGSSAGGNTANEVEGGYMHLLEPLVDGACVEIRSAFKSLSSSTILLAVDYSQVEMRVLAHCCGDSALVEVFNAAARTTAGGGSDVYKRLASNVFRVPVDEVSPPQRSQAKTVALGLVYGLGSQELSRKLGVSVSEANDIQGVFMKTYPGIKRFIFAARKFASKHGYVATMSGRRRHLPDINSGHAGKRTYAERQAVNSIIQGSAADLIACAMVGLSAASAKARQWLQSARHSTGSSAAAPPVALEMEGLAKSRLLLQIHDELLCECPKDMQLCQAFVRRLRGVMEQEAPALLAQVAAAAREQLLQGHATSASKPTAADISSILGSGSQLQVPLATTAQVGSDWGSMVAVESS